MGARLLHSPTFGETRVGGVHMISATNSPGVHFNPAVSTVASNGHSRPTQNYSSDKDVRGSSIWYTSAELSLQLIYSLTD